MLLAETVLMATGLLELPTGTHVRAARSILSEMRNDLLDALDREEPGRLILCPERVSYFDRLTNPPDYEAMAAALEPLLGTEAADNYTVLHQNARQSLLGLRPSSTIDTVLGPKVLPLDAISEARWALEVDAVEGPRLVADIAAGALLKEVVDVFSAVFPESYGYLIEQLDLALAKKTAATKSWEPAPWLADSLRVFERRPFGATLELKEPKAPEPPPTPKKGAKLDTEALKTRSQST